LGAVSLVFYPEREAGGFVRNLQELSAEKRTYLLRVRALATVSLIFIFLGCARVPVGGYSQTSDSELQRFVGQKVTLHGPFELYGKIAPYILYRNHEQVYLDPSGSGSFTWGPEYDAFQGRIVSVTGILKIRHSKHKHVPRNETWQEVSDYYYFDAEKAKITLG
jgi:hypothetical protein